MNRRLPVWNGKKQINWKSILLMKQRNQAGWTSTLCVDIKNTKINWKSILSMKLKENKLVEHLLYGWKLKKKINWKSILLMKLKENKLVEHLLFVDVKKKKHKINRKSILFVLFIKLKERKLIEHLLCLWNQKNKFNWKCDLAMNWNTAVCIFAVIYTHIPALIRYILDILWHLLHMNDSCCHKPATLFKEKTTL